jgi:Nif-specific regulatory protein
MKITMDAEANNVQIRNEAGELRLLFEVSQALENTASEDMSPQLENALSLMARYTGMMRGTISLLNPEGTEIINEIAYGLGARQMRQGHYRLGEGIIGTVVQTGRAVAVPNVSAEPLFLNRTGARDLQKEEISFICVPINVDGKTLGALSADRLFADSVSLQEDMRLLQVLAFIIAKAVRLRSEFKAMQQAMLNENRRLQQMVHGSLRAADRLIGKSAAMQAVLMEIAQVANSNATVLIRGQSGTGKELVAGIIHANSPRAGRPFVRVNCAALPEALVESELFGHERGAFTGAVGARKGRFELAHGGTLFLDEVGDMTPLTQAKLLRALQEKEFERVGGTETRRVDVRLIAATNRDLEQMVEEGAFRQDLYYRLSVVPVLLPPLAQHKEDILPLATHFIDQYSQENKKTIVRITPQATMVLMEYSWPGNIRELENVMERAVLLCGSDGIIDMHHLPPGLQKGEEPAQGLDESLNRLERQLISKALSMSRGNMAKAAAELKISERIMGLRMKKYNLNFRDFRGADIE